MKELRSWKLLGSDIDGAEIEKIGVRVVAVDFEDFGDESAARPSFDVDDHVERIGDVGLNRAVRQFHSALQNAAREPRQSLLRGTGVDRAQRAGVASVEEL